MPLRNHGNETSQLPGFEEQLVVFKVALLVQLLPFPFEVHGKELDLRLTPTSTSSAPYQCASHLLPVPPETSGVTAPLFLPSFLKTERDTPECRELGAGGSADSLCAGLAP